MFPELANQQPPKPELEPYYWRLSTKDGREVKIPPSAVEAVRRKIVAREAIATTSMTIPFSEVKSFYKTSERAVTVPLIEEAAKAFGEPIVTTLDDGTSAVKARWVKREVTNEEWNRYYSKGSYKRLGNEQDGLVTIAFVVAAHQVNLERVSYCTPEEIRNIDKD